MFASTSRASSSAKERVELHQVFDVMSKVFNQPSGPGLEKRARVSENNELDDDEEEEDTDGIDGTLLPEDIFDGRNINLNIGGIYAKDGWYNVNPKKQPQANTWSHTDIVRLMHDLKGFPNESVSSIFASHVLTHGSFGSDAIFHRTLVEWNRVLKPAAEVSISVPDLRVLAELYLDNNLSTQERWTVTLMIYGSQSNELDYHMVGVDEDMLRYWLQQHGFCNIKTVDAFHLTLADISSMTFKDRKISLNIIAKKC